MFVALVGCAMGAVALLPAAYFHSRLRARGGRCRAAAAEGDSGQLRTSSAATAPAVEVWTELNDAALAARAAQEEAAAEAPV